MAAPLRNQAVAPTTAQTPAPVFTAATRALAVPELLENILLKLSEPRAYQDWTAGIVDLFVVQRVCRDFHDATKASIHIRRAMLLESDNVARGYGLEFLLDRDKGRLTKHKNFPSISFWQYNLDLNGNVEVVFDCKYEDGAIITDVIGDPATNTVSYFSSPAGCSERSTPRRLVTWGKFFAKDASWRRMKLFERPVRICIRLFTDVCLSNGEPRTFKMWPVFVFDQATQLLGSACDSLLAYASSTGPQCKHFQHECEKAQARWYHAGRQWLLAANLDHPVVRKHVKAVGKHNAGFNCGREKGRCAWCSTSRWAWWWRSEEQLGPMMDLMRAAMREGLI